MSSIEKTLELFCSIQPNKTLLIAYSGGVDSQVLLHALSQLKNQKKINNPLLTCHVNHGLSEHSSVWQSFTEQQSKQRNICYYAVNVSLDSASSNLEELARKARYQAFGTYCDNNTLVLTAHHSDDQSETFLLSLKRGAGVKGLSAIKPEQQLYGLSVMRPLLTISQQSIIAYAKAQNLSWVEDESNLDRRFDRNFIRHEVMPLLASRWPSISKSINRSAQHCGDAQHLLDEVAASDLARYQSQDNALLLSDLKTLSQARFNNLIRYFLKRHHCDMPSAQQLRQVFHQCFCAKDKTPAIKLGRYWLRRYQDQLYLTPDYQDLRDVIIDVTTAIYSQQPIVVDLPDNLGQLSFNSARQCLQVTHANKIHYLTLPAGEQSVSIRFEHQNERCLPDYRQHHRPMKKILQELALAPWLRVRVPFLYYDEQLVAAIGLFTCQPYLSDALHASSI